MSICIPYLSIIFPTFPIFTLNTWYNLSTIIIYDFRYILIILPFVCPYITYQFLEVLNNFTELTDFTSVCLFPAISLLKTRSQQGAFHSPLLLHSTAHNHCTVNIILLYKYSHNILRHTSPDE